MKWHKNPVAHRRLHRGHRGADVKGFQRGLNKRAAQRGWKDRTATDGVYGNDAHRLYVKVRWAIGLPKGHPPTIGAQLNVRRPATRSPAAKRRAQARRPKRPVKGQLTKHFHLSEFDCNDGTKVPDYMEDHLREWCKRYGEPMRATYGPVAVSSGYRHARYNASIGGASQSYHVYELRKSQPAADCVFGKGSPSQWAGSARSLRGSSGGVGQYSTFVHMDTRTWISDWWG